MVKVDLPQKSALDVAAIFKAEREFHEAKAAKRAGVVVGGGTTVGGGSGVAVGSSSGGGGSVEDLKKSPLVADIEKIRCGIQETLKLVGDIDSLDKMPAAMDKLTNLDTEVKELRQEVQKFSKEVVAALGKLEAKLNSLSLAPQSAGSQPCSKAAGDAKTCTAKKEEDDIDLFGSDDDEKDPEAEKLRQERLAAYETKKAKKPVIIAKSNIILDVKPWDDETDLKEMEAKVRSIEMDGLLWGASKFVEIAFGIKKLQISCVVEDDKVSVDLLEETITGFEDLVQSIDIAAFNKI